MKAVVVLSIVTLCNIFAESEAEFTEKQMMMLKPIKDECLQKTGIDEDVLKTFGKEVLVKYKATGQMTDPDEKTKCYLACITKKIGFMSEEGKFDVEKTRVMLSVHMPVDKLNLIIENCKNEVGENDCDTAAKLLTCFMKNAFEMKDD